jgi:hypothetical protein
MGLLTLVLIVFLYLLTALPLHLAVKFLGGKTNLLKTALVNIFIGFIVYLIKEQFHLIGGFIAFFVSAVLYREFFKLKWFKAFLVWLLELVFLGIFWLIGLMLKIFVGIGLLYAVFN